MRIQAARVTAEHPRLLEDLEAERLNLSSLCLLAPHVNPGNIDELVVAATHRTNAEIRQWLAARFAPPKGPTAPAARQLQVRLPQPAARQVRVEPPVPPVIPVPPSGPEPGPPLAYQMQFTMTGEDHKRFRYAQALLSHAIPSGEVAAIYRRAIEAVIAECEKRKVASTSRPRPENKRPVGGSRHVPAQVRRAVWARDGARCTFVAPSGQRCCARRLSNSITPVPWRAAERRRSRICGFAVVPTTRRPPGACSGRSS